MQDPIARVNCGAKMNSSSSTLPQLAMPLRRAEKLSINYATNAQQMRNPMQTPRLENGCVAVSLRNTCQFSE
jgi:hypothetical protein